MMPYIHGEITVRCTDGKYRICPAQLVPALKQSFGPDSSPVAVGPVMEYANGVRVKLIDDLDIPYGEGFDALILPHIVLCGPSPGKEDMPPRISPKEVDKPLAKTVQVYNPDIYNLADNETRPWLVAWHDFNIPDARKAAEALLETMGIHIYINIVPVGYAGIWHIRKTRIAPANRLSAKVIETRRLRGSKYPWNDLLEGIPFRVRSSNLPALHGNFRSWAKSRRITWKIKIKTVSEGIVEIMRVPTGTEKKTVTHMGNTLGRDTT
jgi:hypothetical protein